LIHPREIDSMIASTGEGTAVSTEPLYSSHGVSMTWAGFIQLEVVERGNYKRAEVEDWAKKHGLVPDIQVIWASQKKWVANKYNLLAEDWDTAQDIPEDEMDVYEVRGTIIPESDDGDEGVLVKLKNGGCNVIKRINR
jgi:hypothetical protein